MLQYSVSDMLDCVVCQLAADILTMRVAINIVSEVISKSFK